MAETKSKKVTFEDHLPRGTVGTFTHDGQRWFAYPQSKVQAIDAVLNRAVGVVERMHDDLVGWVNDHPEDAARVTQMLGRTVAFKGLAMEKIQAWTMRGIGDEESAQEEPADQGSNVGEGGDTGEAQPGA